MYIITIIFFFVFRFNGLFIAHFILFLISATTSAGQCLEKQKDDTNFHS